MGESVETGTVGGGAAAPLGEDFAQFLMQLLETGQFGNVAVDSPEITRLREQRTEFEEARGLPPGLAEGRIEEIDAQIAQLQSQQRNIGGGAVDQTQGIAQALNDIISGPDVTGTQSAVQQIIQQQSGRDVADLRERFTAGGGSQGTPSAVAEGLFRSELAPKLAAVTGQLDLAASQQQIQALSPILQVLSQFSGRGVSQATPFVQVKEGPLQTIAGLAQGAGSAASGFGALNLGAGAATAAAV